MKAILSALALSFILSVPAQAAMDVDADKAWKLTDEHGSEIVFEPVLIEDPETHLKWMVATSCDPKADECAAFEFNVDHVKMTKVSPKLAKQFLNGELKAF
jgi:hypothetical protein